MKKINDSMSIQAMLWEELTAKQQAEVAAVFRHMKKCSQVRMCFAMLDYIWDGILPKFDKDDLLTSSKHGKLRTTAKHFHLSFDIPRSEGMAYAGQCVEDEIAHFIHYMKHSH